MRSRNIELVRSAYELLNARDWDALEAVLDPRAELRPPAEYPDFETYRGIEALRRYEEQLNQVWESFESHPEALFDAGDRVLVFTRTRGTGRGSGVNVDVEAGHVWTIRDGKLAGLAIYIDRDEAKAAARLDG